MNNDNTSIAIAVAQYLAALTTEEKQDGQQELNKFVRWCGGSRLISSIKIHEVENYGGQLSESANNPLEKLKPIKAFLTYAKKVKLITEGLSVHLRVKKSKKKKDVSAGGRSRDLISLTQKGYEELQAELSELIKERPGIAEMIRLAAADKDVRENAPLEAARERQGQVEARIRELEVIVKSSVIVSQEESSTIKAKIGTKVTICDLSVDEQLCYTLVHPSEANLAKGKISTDSPIGKAILGQRVGVVVKVIAPVGKLSYRIDEISY